MKKIIASPRRVAGPVTLLTWLGFGYGWNMARERRRFRSIDALASVLVYSHLALSPKGELVDVSYGTQADEKFWRSGRYRLHQVLDGDDLLIPAHVVMQDLAAISRDRSAAFDHLRLWRRHWPQHPSTYYRNGPIPGAIFRRRRPRTYRRSGTFAEVRAAVALGSDDEALQVSLRVRAKRSRSNIGDNDWEGTWSHRDDHSWKRHRKTQWK